MPAARVAFLDRDSYLRCARLTGGQKPWLRLATRRGCQPVTEGLKLGTSSGGSQPGGSPNGDAGGGKPGGGKIRSANGKTGKANGGAAKESRKASRKATGDSPEARRRGMALLREAVQGHDS